MPLSHIDPHEFQAQQAAAPFLLGDDLPLPNVLNPDQIQQRFDEHQVAFGQRGRAFWTPFLTFWAFLRQTLAADGFRTLKSTLGLSDLRCLTPCMVEKELWRHCLGYNLVRKVAAQAALLAASQKYLIGHLYTI